MNVNLSVVQLLQTDIVEIVQNALKDTGLSPRNLTLEVTESLAIDDMDRMKKILAKIKDLGVRIALDDFGTGYSSLSYLKGLPIDTLKIDKSFVDAMLVDDNARIITESIVYMVRKLGFETIAEGVETNEQFEYLKSIECDCIQGFLLGKPIPKDEVERLLLRS